MSVLSRIIGWWGCSNCMELHRRAQKAESRHGGVPRTPAGQLEMLLDLYAPMDEDGFRHPEAGIISVGDFNRLLRTTSAKADK